MTNKQEEYGGSFCKCPPKDKHGQTAVMCCNHCGMPDEPFWQPPTADPIPQEVRGKIEKEAHFYAEQQALSLRFDGVYSHIAQNERYNNARIHFLKIAEFSYSLALPRIKELERENKRLREGYNRYGQEILVRISETLMRIVNGDGGVKNEIVLRAYKILANDILTFPLHNVEAAQALAGKKEGEV